MAQGIDRIRLAKITMKTVTAEAAIEKIQVDPLASEKAAPGLRTNRNVRMSPQTGTVRPSGSSATTQILVN